MAVLICKMCGGNLEITEGMTTARCPYCGTNQTLPRLDDERRLRLYDRANHFRRSNDYDKAMAVYEQILSEDQTDSEAYWSIVLCRYGIEYVEDPATHKRIPTINRTQYTSVLADEDYKAALRYADVVQTGIYRQEAETIDAIQKGILQVSGKETFYDIFICYKETDENGNRTRESVLADELYFQLTKEGYRVFFARITLEDKLGTAYEPYIFAALNSAKIMIVLGTSPENFQSVWVKNEWSRYLSLIRQGQKKVLIPAYRDMDPYDLPEEFSHLQALDMSRLGFVQDLIRGVKKILDAQQSTVQKREEPRPLSEASGIDYQVSNERPRKTGWEPYGWKRGIAVGVALVLGILLINSKGIYNRWQMDHGKLSETSGETSNETLNGTLNGTSNESDEPRTSGGTGKRSENGTWQTFPDFNGGQEQGGLPLADESETVFSGVMEQFVSRLYQCPAKDVTDAQLAKIKQLAIKRDWDVWQVGYSYEEPAQDFADRDIWKELVWMNISNEEELDLGCLPRFSGLIKLDADTYLDAEDIEGLALQSISLYFESPAQVAEILEYPEDVTELGFPAGVESLDGIDAFENLETLNIDYSELYSIDDLIYAEHLKNLRLVCEETLTDFAVLGKLSGLERISLVADGIKTLDFAVSLTELESLEITGGKLLNLSGLENCTALRRLSVTECMELKDLSVVAGLQNLEELALAVPYGCPEPELESLTGLKKLSLDQFQDCSFVENMTGLTELNLSGCSLPEDMDFSKLTSLKAFSCTYVTSFQIDTSVIESMKALEYLDLHGVEVFDDVSGLFSLPNLKELNIDGMECEIDFDAVAQNPSLEILHMDNMLLYENIQVDYSSGIIMADWDTVSFDEHTDFLKKFPGLKELYLSENALTDISFASELSALEILDISENYVTQLRPLAELPALQMVVCTGNPLKNEKALKDSVVIVNGTDRE